MTDKNKTNVTLSIDRRQWEGLQFEAGLLTQVFGRKVTPERVAVAMMERTLQARERRFAR